MSEDHNYCWFQINIAIKEPVKISFINNFINDLCKIKQKMTLIKFN